MDKHVSRSFRSSDKLFSGLGADAMAALATANSDIALIVSANSEVVDVAYRDKGLRVWDIEGWVGKFWSDTVTVESRGKIEELLKESTKSSPTRSRQVNHPAANGLELPINYRLVAFSGWPHMVALGTDMRPMAEMQQRLVRSQIEMEKDYRKLRDIESRYRILFHLAVEPLIVVEARTLRILDANEGAAQLLQRPIKKLVGMSVISAFAKTDQAIVADALSAQSTRAHSNVFRARPSALDHQMEIRVTPFREFGKTNLLVGFSSEQSAPTSAAPSSAATMTSVFDHLPEGVVIVDADANIVQANPAFLDMIRVISFDRIDGQALDNWLGGSSVDLQVLMANLRDHGTVRRFSSVVRDELGGTETVEVSAARIEAPEGRLFGFALREQSRSDATNPASFGFNQGAGASFIDLVGRVPLKDLVRDTADVIERMCIEAALRLTDNNRASAADMLGLSRQSLYIKLKRYGLSDSEESEE